MLPKLRSGTGALPLSWAARRSCSSKPLSVPSQTCHSTRWSSLQDLLRKYQDDIARSIVLEQGKTLSDAKGDVLRGIQVVEAACALPQLSMGEKLEVSKDMDTETRKVPLGVTAAICPYAAFPSSRNVADNDT